MSKLSTLTAVLGMALVFASRPAGAAPTCNALFAPAGSLSQAKVAFDSGDVRTKTAVLKWMISRGMYPLARSMAAHARLGAKNRDLLFGAVFASGRSPVAVERGRFWVESAPFTDWLFQSHASGPFTELGPIEDWIAVFGENHQAELVKAKERIASIRDPYVASTREMDRILLSQRRDHGGAVVQFFVEVGTDNEARIAVQERFIANLIDRGLAARVIYMRKSQAMGKFEFLEFHPDSRQLSAIDRRSLRAESPSFVIGSGDLFLEFSSLPESGGTLLGLNPAKVAFLSTRPLVSWESGAKNEATLEARGYCKVAMPLDLAAISASMRFLAGADAELPRFSILRTDQTFDPASLPVSQSMPVASEVTKLRARLKLWLGGTGYVTLLRAVRRDAFSLDELTKEAWLSVQARNRLSMKMDAKMSDLQSAAIITHAVSRLADLPWVRSRQWPQWLKAALEADPSLPKNWQQLVD